jgi:serine/threonine-protein kinase
MTTGSNLALVRTDSTVADKYQIVRPIKSGGMGEVYEARHVKLGRRVAIKFLRSTLAQDATHKARFDREASVAGGLEHENIVPLLDIGSDEQGVPFIVMEYVVGETLRTIIDESAPLPVPRAVAMALQICAGLQAAHARGIIHRDLKPDNLMVSTRTDGRDWVRILDFGIARTLHATAQPDVTAAGEVLGTAHYMSPEQARGETIDVRSDVHAVGAILYELLSGEKVHPGETYNAAIYHVLRKEYSPLDSLRPTLPYDLVGAVHRALAAQPSERFASVEDFASSLSTFAKADRTVVERETITGTRRITPPGAPHRSVWGWAIAAVVVCLLSYLSLHNNPTPGTHGDPPPKQVAAPLKPATTPKPAATQSIPPSTRTDEPTQPMATPAPELPAASSPSPTKPREPRTSSGGPSSFARKPATRSAPSAAASGPPPPTVPEGFVENPYGR